MKKKVKKEYSNWDGLKMSFIASVNLAKHVWDLPPDMVVDWYINMVTKQGRYVTAATAELYRQALEAEFNNWIARNYQKKMSKKSKNKAITDEERAAINYLKERGYKVYKNI